MQLGPTHHAQGFPAERDSEILYTWQQDVPPKMGWLHDELGQKVIKEGWWDIV